MITIATQAARRSSETSETSAAVISSLSASGSISLPKVVIDVARAGEVAVEPVGQRREGEDAGGQRVAVRRLPQQRDDDDRHRDDAQQGEDVGKVEREHPAHPSGSADGGAGCGGCGERRAARRTAPPRC